MRKAAMLQIICVLALGQYLALAGGARSQDDDAVARFFKAKQVMLFIGAPVGGGFDTYGRLVGRYIGNHIPGNPTVVTQNMAGASGMTLVSYLLTSARQDGTVIAAIEPNNVRAPLLTEMTAPQYDVRRLIYLGSAESEDVACWVRKDAEVKVFSDVFSKTLLVGAAAPGGNSFDLPTVENKILGTKFKVVPGYTGDNEVLLAMERNEVQAICGAGVSTMSTMRSAWVSSGFVKILVQENDVGSAELNAAGVPRTIDFAKTPEARQVLTLIYGQQKFGRPFAMPPGVPPERAAALRRAFVDVLKDKQLLADAEKLKLDIEAMPGEELQSVVNELYNSPSDVVEKARLVLDYGAAQKQQR